MFCTVLCISLMTPLNYSKPSSITSYNSIVHSICPDVQVTLKGHICQVSMVYESEIKSGEYSRQCHIRHQKGLPDEQKCALEVKYVNLMPQIQNVDHFGVSFHAFINFNSSTKFQQDKWDHIENFPLTIIFNEVMLPLWCPQHAHSGRLYRIREAENDYTTLLQPNIPCDIAEK